MESCFPTGCGDAGKTGSPTRSITGSQAKIAQLKLEVRFSHSFRFRKEVQVQNFCSRWSWWTQPWNLGYDRIVSYRIGLVFSTMLNCFKIAYILFNSTAISKIYSISYSTQSFGRGGRNKIAKKPFWWGRTDHPGSLAYFF